MADEVVERVPGRVTGMPVVTDRDHLEVRPPRRMFLSEHTVQDHLKSIFAKTSTHNRRTLLSRAVGS